MTVSEVCSVDPAVMTPAGSATGPPTAAHIKSDQIVVRSEACVPKLLVQPGRVEEEGMKYYDARFLWVEATDVPGGAVCEIVDGCIVVGAVKVDIWHGERGRIKTWNGDRSSLIDTAETRSGQTTCRTRP